MNNPLRIFDRATIAHLRIPFSVLLLPIFCFALSQAGHVHWIDTAVVFVVLHFFIYPGSNGYNSYMDRDMGSIGGLRHPPPVTRNLYHASIVCDTVGLLLCLLVGARLLLLMLCYVLVSKAYSWHGLRLKKHAISGWVVVVLFQGGYTFMLVNMCCGDQFSRAWFTAKNELAMLIATLLIGGFYPLTQIYQHEEDGIRGDHTISYRLGILGTFVFSAGMFLTAAGLSFYYFQRYYTSQHFVLYCLCMLPGTAYFLYWYASTVRDRSLADFAHAMRMTVISSASMITCFTVLFFKNHPV